MKKVIKEQLKSEVLKITPKIEKLVNEQLESEVLIRSSKEAKTSHAVVANLSEMELKNILIDKKKKKNDGVTNLSADTYAIGHNIKTRDGADDDQEPSAGTN
ncbi:hypothetical protein Tco_0702631 [Tanacetum coccineum]|uniref:Uncharacterized protein n=1 Tax=Tanacetum coccineum TaxID=301880 RepID=A0ABQ4XYC5_9ASTR